jgi:signal transduction histidine kinase
VTVSRAKGRPGTTLTRPLLEFFAAGFLTLALVGVGASVLLARTFTREETHNAESAAADIVRGPVQGVLSDAIVDRDPAAVALVDTEVHRELLGQLIVAVKLRRQDGLYVYSSDPGVAGTYASTTDRDDVPFATGRVAADASRLHEPDDAPERALQQRLFEVYQVVHTPSGQPLLLETYVRYAGVASSARDIFVRAMPALVGALVVLGAVQVPLALSLARRVRRAERRQDQLLQHAAVASDAERRRIVADLHDGVVQELAGLNYSLTRVADHMDSAGDGDVGTTLRQAATTTRRSIQALRNLLVDIYPANLHEEGLSTALHDLVASTISSAKTDVFIDPSLHLTERNEALIYRGAQEAVRNAARHSGAGTVVVRVLGEGDMAVLEIVDDGRGFDPTAETTGGDHLGLRLLSDLASGADGKLEITSAPGEGTHVRFEVPA